MSSNLSQHGNKKLSRTALSNSPCINKVVSFIFKVSKFSLCRYGANANVFGELGFYSWGLNTSWGHCQLIYMRKPF